MACEDIKDSLISHKATALANSPGAGEAECQPAARVTRRGFLRGVAGVLGVGVGVGLYSWRWETHWLEVVDRPLPVANLPGRLNGARLVQMSDLHIGPMVDDDYLLRTFKRVQDLAPEIVVYTGDITTYSRDLFSHAGRMFPHLPLGSQATLGVLGNHDYGPFGTRPEVADRIAAMAGAAGVRILRNEVAEVAGLQVLGCDELWARRFQPGRAVARLQPHRAALALSHNPDTADKPVWGQYAGWILAGHTHGGQCKPPFLPPPLLPVRNRRYTAGEFALDGGRRMYINRGIGHTLPVRFNVRPEVTVFHLETA
jgi:predicted MPP superfamily phosphohydrolase